MVFKITEFDSNLYREMKSFPGSLPIDDIYAYSKYPELNWVYNKLILYKELGIKAIPHGVEPVPFEPAFSKPICNIYGMSKGAKIVRRWSDKEYEAGHLLMPLLNGEQISTDWLVDKGEIIWRLHSYGKQNKEFNFDYWKFGVNKPRIEEIFGKLIQKYFKDYTGFLNTEFIGETCIEIHLRHSDDRVEWYGLEWLNSVADYFNEGKKEFPNIKGWMIPVFSKYWIKVPQMNYPKTVHVKFDHNNGWALCGSGLTRICQVFSLDYNDAEMVASKIKAHVVY